MGTVWTFGLQKGQVISWATKPLPNFKQ